MADAKKVADKTVNVPTAGGTILKKCRHSDCGNIQTTVWNNDGRISATLQKGYRKRDDTKYTNINVPLFGLREVGAAIAVLTAAQATMRTALESVEADSAVEIVT